MNIHIQMSCLPHVSEPTSSLKAKISLEMWLNGYTPCSYSPDVVVKHLENTMLLVVLMDSHVSGNIEISCFNI